MNENYARPSPALVETIAGLAAGVASTLTAHPLDVIKTRLQSLFYIEKYWIFDCTDATQSTAVLQVLLRTVSLYSAPWSTPIDLSMPYIVGLRPIYLAMQVPGRYFSTSNP